MATLEQDITDRRAAAQKRAAEAESERQREINDWKSPLVEEGTDVVWFEAADDKRMPAMAKVIRVRGKFCDLQLQSRIFNAVRHIQDPSLVNPNHRENGAWDFSPSWKTNLAERKALLDEMQALRSRVEHVENELGIKRAEEAAVELPDPRHKKK